MSGQLTIGDSVTWQARHFGMPFRMTSKVTEYEAGLRFVDEQQSGPFAYWWHEHRFIPLDGKTEMTDFVRYRAPVGFVGRLVDRVALRRYMVGLLESRNAWLKADLER